MRLVSPLSSGTSSDRAERRGTFITFEGGEGTGKSTQLRMVADALPTQPVTTREPGGTTFAERLRTLLLNGSVAPFGPDAEAIAFAAARADHVDEVIAPALNTGRVVLSDRYVDSSRAYQRNIGSAMDPLQRIAMRGAVPDLTLIYDLDPEVGRERVRERDGTFDRFEGSELVELHRRRSEFLAIAAREPDRCIVIAADAEPAVVHERTLQAIRSRVPHVLDGSEGAPDG